MIKYIRKAVALVLSSSLLIPLAPYVSAEPSVDDMTKLLPNNNVTSLNKECTKDFKLGDEVEIKDESLKKSIVQALNHLDVTVSNGIITKGDLDKLKSLFIFVPGVKCLDGIEHAENLNNLVVSGNEIEDISSLKCLKKLSLLEIKSNNISDITPLSNLSNLTHLNISENNIKDIRPLANLAKLEYLNIEKNPITLANSEEVISNLGELKTFVI